MLTVVKRSGKQEAFDLEKVAKTLAHISDQLHQPLTGGDLNLIKNELMHMVEGKEVITSYHIYVMIAGILYTNGFLSLLEAYTSHATNKWRV